MVATTLHLNWYNPVEIQLAPGLLWSRQPHQPFVVLADPAAIPIHLENTLRQQWADLCLDWIWQQDSLSSMATAEALANTVWPALEQMPHAALWAIGGGTTLDLGKVLRWRLPDQERSSCQSHWRNNLVPEGTLRHPLWCSPTTSGTGSEVTPWATLWDLQHQPSCKRSWHPENGHPEKAWIDPTLTLTCPPGVTRDTGLDALSHALESLWNRHANRLSRPIAIEAARCILETLPALLREPDNIYLRTQMAKASLMAGLAMSQTRTALAHALSYDLTLQEHLPHGQACAVWLPMTMSLAAKRSAQVRHDLGAIFQQPLPEGLNTLRKWLIQLGIEPRDLRDSETGLTQLEQALKSERGNNFIEELA
jgi:alcohol dehydrogenase